MCLKAAANIFKKIGFDPTEHIGQKKAKREGSYPDIRIRASTLPSCGSEDTKATVKYDFGIGDVNKLGAFYKECRLKFPDKTPASFFLCIAGGVKVSTARVPVNPKQLGSNTVVR